MTLQRKFSLLLLMVILAVGLIAGTSLWSINVLQREVTAPLDSIRSVLGGLMRVHEASARITGMLEADDRESGYELDTLTGIIDRELDALERDDTYQVRSGISTTRAIRARAERLGERQRAWVQTGDAKARTDAIEAATSLTVFIERVQTRTLGDMALVSLHAGEVRRLVFISLIIAVVSVLLTGWLGAMLVRRWIVAPVRALREAASRFGAGDLDYRIDVAGSDELAALSSEVNAMAQTISYMHEERIERERLAAVGEMVRRVAHNLRNPLAGIRSLAELTRADVETGSDAAVNQDRIVQTIDRFDAWVSQLLTATRPLSPAPRQTAVHDWIEPIVELRRAAAERIGVTLTLDTSSAPKVATFDARLLEQAAGAIIDNAIGVTPRGGHVRVTVSSCEHHWRLDVHDAGPGVPEELLDKIFQPYFTTRRDGTGLGLAMARQVVEQHRGRIEATSGDGATFSLILPFCDRSHDHA